MCRISALKYIEQFSGIRQETCTKCTTKDCKVHWYTRNFLEYLHKKILQKSLKFWEISCLSLSLQSLCTTFNFYFINLSLSLSLYLLHSLSRSDAIKDIFPKLTFKEIEKYLGRIVAKTFEYLLTQFQPLRYCVHSFGSDVVHSKSDLYLRRGFCANLQDSISIKNKYMIFFSPFFSRST